MDIDRTIAFEAGRDACLRNAPRRLNPYAEPALAQAWERGWLSQHEWMMLDLKWRASDRERRQGKVTDV